MTETTATNRINQNDINKAVWDACDTFRCVISADTYKDFVLTMLFLKYISDVYKDEYQKLIDQHGDNPDKEELAGLEVEMAGYLQELGYE